MQVGIMAGMLLHNCRKPCATRISELMHLPGLNLAQCSAGVKKHPPYIGGCFTSAHLARQTWLRGRLWRLLARTESPADRLIEIRLPGCLLVLGEAEVRSSW